MNREAVDPSDAIETMILPRSRDLGGFEVSRVLPAIGKRMVGPFIFLDQMGPTTLSPQHGLDVLPHPHIGLSTVTYLFEGTIVHRDSVGSVQAIEPGAVNWMTAGSGIAHSERTPPEQRQQPSRIFGIQSWVALPKSQEEVAPSFVHHGADTLPHFEMEGSQVRVIAGSMFGATSPVATASPLFYAEIRMSTGSSFGVPAEFQERAIYLIDGQIELDGKVFDAARLLVLKHGPAFRLRAVTPVHLLLLGGEPMDGPRYIWWNFVSSSQARIEAAKADWKARRFDRVIGETEFIPLPE
ncbi:pirin family protein [Dongia soli]|uniref:Pirin family protein n=1 Tax=Dongia soli TaxID=600628 RepID=A0ABU5EK08_9PROT|nr:pirin family protein [Dongia soli]MDY0885558.1 pirin family protein [Dongia soli]